MTWTSDRVEQLKALHRAGLSAGQMARALGGVTRSACIGKCHRLGLGPIGGGKASAPMRRKETLRILGRPARQPAPKGVMVLNPVRGGDVATAASVENMAAREKPAENVRLMARAFAPLPGHEPVPFGSRGCKWPCGGEGAEMVQCGAPRDEKRDGCPYCAAHAAVAYQKPKAGAPKNGNELARSLRRYTDSGRVAA